MSIAPTIDGTAVAPLAHGLEAMAASTLADRYADPRLVADIVPA